MHALIIPAGINNSAKGAPVAARPTMMVRHPLSTVPGGYDEKWLRRLLLSNPSLVPLEKIEHRPGNAIPLCDELPLAREGGTTSLDLLFVTRSGRLMLIECKLWRNPQARREVVAQALEYAALLKGWSYGDLTARLKQKMGWRGANPIYDLAKAVWSDLEETAFVDAVSRSLEVGDFHVVIAGDGIRADLEALVRHVNSTAHGIARLSLMEFQVWRADSGDMVVVPAVPLKTEIIEQRVIMTNDGRPPPVREVHVDRTIVRSSGETSDSDARPPSPKRAEKRERNNVFWERFIQDMQFDHPDQTQPTHGGDNWVKVGIFGPMRWLAAYRSEDGVMGVSATLTGDGGRLLVSIISDELDGLRGESGLDLRIQPVRDEPYKSYFLLTEATANLSDDEQRVWLKSAVNRLVTLIRPRLDRWAALMSDASPAAES